MPSRIREITDPFGLRIRLSIERHLRGAVIALQRVDFADAPKVLLDTYCAELLSGFIMAARLSLPHGLPQEHCAGGIATDFQLHQEPRLAIEVRQPETGRSLEITPPFWDKLYAELCLAIPHARELARSGPVLVH